MLRKELAGRISKEYSTLAAGVSYRLEIGDDAVTREHPRLIVTYAPNSRRVRRPPVTLLRLQDRYHPSPRGELPEPR